MATSDLPPVAGGRHGAAGRGQREAGQHQSQATRERTQPAGNGWRVGHQDAHAGRLRAASGLKMSFSSNWHKVDLWQT